jgi:cytochrome c5
MTHQSTQTNRPTSRVALRGFCLPVVALSILWSGAGRADELPATGQQAYEQGCASCHASGANGAPIIGDHAAWGLRIAQGRLTLYRHTIAGKGAMPARGGTQWPDATIRLAVDYMVSRNNQ